MAAVLTPIIQKAGFTPKHVSAFDLIFNMPQYYSELQSNPNIVIVAHVDSHATVMHQGRATEIFGNMRDIQRGLRVFLKKIQK